MDTGKRLAEIWNESYISSLPSLVKDRGYMYADNVQRDVLITGFNPSFRDGEAVLFTVQYKQSGKKKSTITIGVLYAKCFMMATSI